DASRRWWYPGLHAEVSQSSRLETRVHSDRETSSPRVMVVTSDVQGRPCGKFPSAVRFAVKQPANVVFVGEGRGGMITVVEYASRRILGTGSDASAVPASAVPASAAQRPASLSMTEMEDCQ